jgi:putative membrane protein
VTFIPGIQKEQAEIIKQLLMENSKAIVMDVNFNFTHQRQSPVEVLVLFFFIRYKICTCLFWPIILIYIFKFKDLNDCTSGIGSFVISNCIGVISYLRYRSFTFFWMKKGEFIISDGILNKTKTGYPI